MPPDSGVFEIIINDGRHHRIVPVRLGDAFIGRSDENTIQLDDPDVSRRHARLVREGRRIWIEDLGSHNGVWVNDHRVKERARIFARDIVKIGIFSLELNGESLKRRGDETTEPSIQVKMPAAASAEETTDRTRQPLPTNGNGNGNGKAAADEERTAIVRTPPDGVPVAKRAIATEETRISGRPSRAPPAPYLALFGAFLLLAAALVWLLVDPLATPDPGPFDSNVVVRVEGPPAGEAVDDGLGEAAEVAGAAPAVDTDGAAPARRVANPDTDADPAAAATARAAPARAATPGVESREVEDGTLALEAPGPLTDSDRLLLKAQEALEGGRYHEAQRFARAAAVLEPDNADAARIVARTAEALGAH